MKQADPVQLDHSVPNQVRRVITLVHGTWAPGARWVRSRSALCQKLRERLGPDTKFSRLVWSGRNSHSERQRAALRLRRRLVAQMERHPEARHYVIGHSHGGSVAMYALGDALASAAEDQTDPKTLLSARPLRERISGVVCLATPFLVCRLRDLGSSQRQLLVGAAAALIFAGAFLGDHLSAGAGFQRWPHRLLQFAFAFVTAMTVLFLFKGWQRLREQLIQEMRFSDLKREKLLILRSPADEASAGMAFGQILCQIGVLLFRWMWRAHVRLEKAAEALSRRPLKVLGLGLGAILGYFVACLVAVALWQQANTWQRGVLVVVALLPLVAAISLVSLLLKQVQVATFIPRVITLAMIWPLILLLAAVTLLPFGWQIALASIFLDVTAEPVPPGCWNVHQFEPPKRKEGEQDNLALMHSVIYENPEAIEAICDWIDPPAGQGVEP